MTIIIFSSPNIYVGGKMAECGGRWLSADLVYWWRIMAEDKGGAGLYRLICCTKKGDVE